MSETLQQKASWQQHLTKSLAVMGHRNWILIADAAYPDQSNPGITTVASECDHLMVLEEVLRQLAISLHVRAKLCLDAELAFVAEDDAPGVAALREGLAKFVGTSAHYLPHEEIIHKLDETARLFRVLVLKSTLRIPYTTVFLELDCGYWNAEAENRLRSAMQESKQS